MSDPMTGSFKIYEILAAVVVVASCAIHTAKAGEAGRFYAQQKGYTDQQRQWFRDQNVPGTKTSCCSTADGEEVQEEIRGDEYWIRSGRFVEWTRVPREAVLDTPNKIGAPVVWYADDEEGSYTIRCYSPGVKA